ncbi:hypothetical protein C465_03410 [Halorubrum distributum JCM 9100]|uniref:DUF2061 domain-containing protein n=2 Tax=Halorubrum distributum TaxID=29283 RepID=M0EYU8_9EURY|nr:DUF2061 domain-containing protein [Halorubrum distributum]ELZ51584.1 hypothetical protein C465_03410 [Halorubrum distributum JCM 9100]ELZ52294.1 hypothetical protein C466_11706 [Halorubrum distributum JCM 10118]
MGAAGFSREAIQARRRAVVETGRYLALMVTVAFLVVGDVGQAASIGLVTNVSKPLTYHGHERLWDDVS